MKIVLLENLGVSDFILEQHKKKLETLGHQFLAYEKTADLERLKERCHDADVLMLANMSLPKEVVCQAKKLKMVDIAFTGVDHIPLMTLHERGVVVCNTAGYATKAVAELTISLMIQLLRNTKEFEENFRNGKTNNEVVGHLLYGKTVGIVGAGMIGKQVAFLCKCFGCHVICTNPSPVQCEFIDQQVDFNTLLESSDIVTLHCPLTEKTRNMMNHETFRKMKKSSIFINTARGQIVDEMALKEVLDEHIIAGAASDVFKVEPPLSKDNPLFSCSHFIMTPHIGYATQESLEERANMVFENLYAWLDGTPIRVISK